jgi:hypothetical protein
MWICLVANSFAGRGLAEEFADVSAVDGHVGDNLVVLADRVFDVGSHRAP